MVRLFFFSLEVVALSALLSFAFVSSVLAEATSTEQPQIELRETEPQLKQEDDVVVADGENASVSIAADGVTPRRLRVSPGATVAWINNSEQLVTVRFTGKAVSTTCKAPRGFSVGKAGVYVSNEVSKGEVVSLCFLEPELYVYEIIFSGSEVSESGSESNEISTFVGSVHVVSE